MSGILNDNVMVAVVIPCFKVKKHILQVIASIGSEVDIIYVVDDCCTELTGTFVQKECGDSRVKVIFHDTNKGVGGATISGYRQAISDGASVIVKIDGDGQMDATLIPKFIRPITENTADYTKGNRFYDLENLKTMPWIRLIGNSLLSFVTKLSSGYWNVFDPTNGYTAISRSMAVALPLTKIDPRYFFESDMLFRLNTFSAVVLDIPISSRYADETSNMSVIKIVPEFIAKHASNCCKRLLYNYYLRDFNIASLYFFIGMLSLVFGVVFGIKVWCGSITTGVSATSGTVMLAALPTLAGIQFLLAFFSFDFSCVPKIPVTTRL